MKQAMKMGFIIHNDLVPCDPEMSLFEKHGVFSFYHSQISENDIIIRTYGFGKPVKMADVNNSISEDLLERGAGKFMSPLDPKSLARMIFTLLKSNAQRRDTRTNILIKLKPDLLQESLLNTRLFRNSGNSSQREMG
ncbi:hypothetical protein [Methanogenium organophilum]|uniref:Uncharacterized protein n=1 Tax=Methanogenium organophilum TaxID=2199 RepID=A0A9X9S467_METOG|nr:hypothetical protein [Methanogenium organophilum]WAI01170.1 hypothetical protein OU421_12260 [Methanogenium organophilum]